MQNEGNNGHNEANNGHNQGNNGHNNEMNVAWQFVANTGMSVFLTGKAGTGKTTFLRKLRSLLPKRMVVLAPTGVAAINAGGQTIHSFFQLPLGPFIPGSNHATNNNNRFRMAQQKKNLIRSLDLLVIDEISMVRADLLDQIDDAMRRYRDPYKPFGGVQLLLIGDLMQLSPVAKSTEWSMLSQYYPTPYFFSSRALQQLPYVTVELKYIYRQQDNRFIELLARVRSGSIGYNEIALLNSRYIPNFNPQEREWIRLTTHNNTARDYNNSQLERLSTHAHTYTCTVKGEFPEANYPADPQLTLKPGAQVMFIKNDPTLAHRYYNGKIGTITKIAENFIEVTCAESDTPIEVTPVEWENTKYTLDPVTKEIKEDIIGVFSQYPLRLAWAITVHKSQGLTFDKAVLDINSSFAHGQTYVALSRCRSLEGLVLANPISSSSLITDHTVNSFIDTETSKADENVSRLPSLKYQYNLSLLDELYSFESLTRDYEWFLRVIDEHLGTTYHNFLIRVKAVRKPLEEKLTNIANRFKLQYHTALEQQSGRISGTPLEQRIMDSCRYFSDTVKELFETLVTKDSAINIGNARVAEMYNNALSALRQSVLLKYALFNGLKEKPFTPGAYLDIKAKTLINSAPAASTSKKRSKSKAAKSKATVSSSAKDTVFNKTGNATTVKTVATPPPLPPDVIAYSASKAKPQKTPKTPKTPKPTTLEETLRLFNSGMTPDKIAAHRGLAESTIYGHLGQLAVKGLVDIDDIVPKEHQIIIQKVVDSFTDAYTFKDLRERVPEHINYNEIILTVKGSK